MSTKKETTQTSNNALTFDSASKQLYNKLTGASGSQLLSYINNPLGNSLFKLGLGESQRGAQKFGMQNINALLNNMRVSGIGGRAGNAFQQAQLMKAGRSNLSLMSGANVGNINAALNRQLQATGMGLSFNPLVTGESSNAHSTETTSGLGTWLPQLASAAIGAGMSAATGGMSSFAGAGMSPASGMGAINAGAGNPFAQFNPSFPGFPKNPF